MRFPRFVLLLVLALLAGWSPAFAQQQEEDPADQYFIGYRIFNEGERLVKSGDLKRALDKYLQAQSIFDIVAKTHPTWQSEFVTMRRQRLASAIDDVKSQIEAKAAATPPPAPAPVAAPQANALSPMPAGATPIQLGAPAPSTGDPVQDAFEQMKRAIGSRESALQQQLLDAQGQIGRHAMLADQMSQQRDEAVRQRDEFYKQAAALQGTVEKQQAKVSDLEKQLAGGGKVQAELDKARKELSDAQAQVNALKKRASEAENTMMTKSQQLEEANMKLQLAEKERDENKTKLLGLQAENEVLKKRGPVPENMKDAVAETDRLKKELDDARKQIATLTTNLAGKDKEIGELKGQLSKIQGELTQLKKDNAAYQMQIDDLTTELKKIRDLADDPKKAKPDDAPQLMAENQLLKSIILRQIRQQARQQQLKANVIAEIQKTENASKELVDQVEQLAGSRVNLTDAEQKLFTTPQLQEIMGSEGLKATLMVKSDKPAPAKPGDEEAKKKEAALNQLITKANELLQNQKLTEAAAAYDDVLRADPKNATAFAGLASIRIQQNKLDDAEAVLKKSLAYEPENAIAHYMLGMTMFKLNRLNEAQSAFEKSLATEPKNARARHYLGVILSKMGISDRAEREFKSALAIDPAYGEADFNLAVVYATRNPPQWDLAKKHYAEALKKGVKADPDMEKLLQGAK